MGCRVPKVDEVPKNGLATVTLDDAFFGPAAYHRTTQQNPLAWMLTLFERATEPQYPHPGLLMIDSPQKNLKPTEGEAGDEFRDPAIVARVWNHIQQWSSTAGRSYQIIVVDNAPPPGIEEAVVVRYSAQTDRPPYGLIDDEIS